MLVDLDSRALLERVEAGALLRRQLEEMSVLHALAAAGAELLNEDELIARAVAIISGTLYPDVFGVLLLDETAGVLRIHPGSQPAPAAHPPIVIPLGQGVAGRVAQQGRPLRLGDVAHFPGYIGAIPGMASELCVPLKIGERVLGVLNVESARPDAFGEADERLLSISADQLATALEKVRLYQAMAVAVERRAILYRASQEIGASLDLEQLYTTIHQATSRLMPTEAFILALLTDDETELEGVYLVDKDGRWPAARYDSSRGLTGYVVRTGETLCIADFDEAERRRVGAMTFGSQTDHTSSVLAVPLRLKGRIVGAMSAQSYLPHAYCQDDREFFELLAFHAAIAIENGRLYARAQLLAITDPLTGVYNRRHFFELAERQFAAARSGRRPLSIAMLDIDHFKQVNDSYGHLAGDQVLRAVAAHCRANLRQADVLGRYGGEEFAILLRDATRANARRIAERLRRAIGRASIATERARLAVTVSVGVATLDQACDDLDRLVDRADQALYQAKRHGRNQVAVWSANLP